MNSPEKAGLGGGSPPKGGVREAILVLFSTVEGGGPEPFWLAWLKGPPKKGVPDPSKWGPGTPKMGPGTPILGSRGPFWGGQNTNIHWYRRERGVQKWPPEGGKMAKIGPGGAPYPGKRDFCQI